MHEYSLMQEIIQAILERLNQEGDSGPVAEVVLKLGVLDIHSQEILDNMADCRHLGPTHGAPSEYFENEINNEIYVQRQGGPMVAG